MNELSSSKVEDKINCKMFDNALWIIISRRNWGLVQFNRTWQEYKEGFGGDDGDEYWIGLDAVEELCPTGNRGTPCELAIKMVYTGATHSNKIEESNDFDYWAHYGKFGIGPERTGYKLKIGLFDTEKSNVKNELRFHDGLPFSTVDRDHDDQPGVSCSRKWGGGGGWWFGQGAFSDNLQSGNRRCYAVNLHGQHGDARWRRGNHWRRLTHREDQPMAAVTMMVKPPTPPGPPTR